MPHPSLRRAAIVLHRWVGLVAGVLLAVMGLSGSALVFRAEIDRALNPHLLRVEVAAARRPLASIVAAAAAAHPGEQPRRVRMPQRPDGSIEVWMGAKPDRFVHVDPYTARVLGARRPTEFLTGWLFELHAYLLAGDIGHRTVGVAALVLIGLALSGLVVWWPGRAKVGLALTVARGRGRRRLISDAHRAGGFYVSGLLLISGITGASLIFHEQFEAALDRAFRTPAVPPAPAAISLAALPALPVDRALAAAERVAPGGYVTYVYLPATPEEPVTVRKWLPGELHPNGKTFVYVDPRDATILGYVNGPTSPAGARAYSALYPLHTGVAGGLAMRVLMVLVGLAPAALLVTGALMWRARAVGKARRGAARARVGAASPTARAAARGRQSAA